MNINEDRTGLFELSQQPPSSIWLRKALYLSGDEIKRVIGVWLKQGINHQSMELVCEIIGGEGVEKGKDGLFFIDRGIDCPMTFAWREIEGNRRGERVFEIGIFKTATLY